jgi:hypothetical protein
LKEEKPGPIAKFFDKAYETKRRLEIGKGACVCNLWGSQKEMPLFSRKLLE